MQASASDAIATIMVAARDSYLDESTSHLKDKEKEAAIAEKRGKLVALGSEMSHSSTEKAALITGTKYRSVSTRIEDQFSMTGKGLQTTLERCREEDLEPFYLTTTLGTTGTCAIDRFDEIATVLENHPMIWTHVDAAYAGSALVCEEYQYLTKSFDAFDSFNVNLSKWLLVNLDARYVLPHKVIDTARYLICPTAVSLLSVDGVSPMLCRSHHPTFGISFRNLSKS